MTRNPIFTSYWFYADIEFLLRDNKHAVNYFFNNFLLIYSYGTDDHFNLYFEPSYRHRINHIEILKNCPLIESVELGRGKLELTGNIVKQLIDDGWSIIAKIDKSQITNCPNAGIIWHEAMAYKYRGDCLYFNDNGKSGKYLVDFSCPVDDYVKAFNTMEKSSYGQDEVWKKYFWLCKQRNNLSCEMDLTKIIQSLKIYLNIIAFDELNDAWLRSIYFDLNIFIGQKVYGNLIQYIKYFERNQKKDCPASSHLGGVSVLCDHKRLLVNLAIELEKKYGISEYYQIRLNEILIEMETIRNMILKFYLNFNNKQLLERICNRISSLRRKERKVLLKLTGVLESIGKMAID